MSIWHVDYWGWRSFDRKKQKREKKDLKKNRERQDWNTWQVSVIRPLQKMYWVLINEWMDEGRSIEEEGAAFIFIAFFYFNKNLFLSLSLFLWDRYGYRNRDSTSASSTKPYGNHSFISRVFSIFPYPLSSFFL